MHILTKDAHGTVCCAGTVLVLRVVTGCSAPGNGLHLAAAAVGAGKAWQRQFADMVLLLTLRSSAHRHRTLEQRQHHSSVMYPFKELQNEGRSRARHTSRSKR